MLGFRKFAMALIFLFVAIALLMGDVIPSEDWLKHVASVMIAFQATNVAEHIVAVGKEWINERLQKNS